MPKRAGKKCPGRGNKYSAERTEYRGVTYDSKAEAARAAELHLLELAGEVSNVRRQVEFPLVVNGLRVCIYRADFVYHCKQRGREIVEDVKGMKTDVYKLKAKLMRACYGIDIVETGRRR